MPAVPWASPTQLEFLNSRLLEFASAQNEKRLPAFWPAVYNDFFKLWPNQASEIVPMDEVVSKKRKTALETAGIQDMAEEEWVQNRKTVRKLIAPTETLISVFLETLPLV